MSKLQDDLYIILEWIYNHEAATQRLVVGYWDADDDDGSTYYAVIEEVESGGRGDIRVGESSYGSTSIEEALRELVDELRGSDGGD